MLSVIGAFAIALFLAMPAFGQEYKEAYNAARTAAKANNLTEALQKFTLAANGAKASGDTEVERRSNKVIAQIEYKLGLNATRDEDYAAALQHFESGIARYPSYSKNYLGRGLALKKLDRIDDAIAAFQQAIEAGTAESDRQTARAAETAISEHFVYLASSLLSRNGGKPSSADADQALAHLARLAGLVEPDADVMYYTAEAFKAKGDFAQSVASAEQALELHRGSRTEKAKIYFVMGEALVGLGDTSGAKDAFQNAAVGSYRASAEHYLETLGSR
jgi:tetratricopeptide (TPR) repeat protein